MFEPRTAALVCEGHTDVPILRAALQAIWPELDEVRSFQPELDDTGRARGPGGWSQVKAWCEAHREDLDDVLNPDIGGPIDLLVIAIDVDVALEARIADPPKSVGLYETKRLRRTMHAWLTSSTGRTLPPAVVLSTPVRAIEAWIIAALYPRQAAPERIGEPAEWLVDKGRLRRSTSDGKPWKELYRYMNFAPSVARQLPRVRRACAEAEQTCRAVEIRRDALRTRGR